MVEIFDLKTLPRGAARFDGAELRALSARTLHILPYSAVEDRLTDLRADGGEAFWLTVRSNLATLAEAADWRRVIEGPTEPVAEEPDFLAEAAALLPEEPWDQSVWSAWTGENQSRDRPQGPRAFPPIAARLDRPGGRPGARPALAIDRSR